MMTNNSTLIRDKLVEHGQKLREAPKQLNRFTKDDAADALLNDLDNYPHAFVLACVMDRQIKAERAWFIPYRFQQKLGDFSMQTLLKLSEKDVQQLMAKPEPLHKLFNEMSKFFFKAIQRISTQYQNVASAIWINEPSSADVVYRFLEFEGIGPKIASMAANILSREFKIPFADYYSVDISADVHVRRVFGRLGLTSPDATVEQLIFKARALHPEFPGLMDLPAWEIGRNWCKPKEPQCHLCYMSSDCHTALSH